MHSNITPKLLLAAALLASSCATATSSAPEAPAVVDPLEGFRVGRVGHAAKSWFILPEDDDSARLCLAGPLASPFQHLGTRVKFDAELGAAPADPKACTPLKLKRIAEVPEGDLRAARPAQHDAPAPTPTEPQDDK